MYRIGIIGLGSIGQRMLASIAAHDGFQASVAYDPDPGACGRTAQAHPELQIVGDPTAITGGDRVDLVYVACPPSHHKKYALAAAAAGKPVLCEKPLGVDVAASRDLVERIEATGVPTAVNFLYCSARAGEVLGQAYRQGELGELTWIEARLHLPGWHRQRTAEAPWLARRAAGGFLREVSTHYVLLVSRLLALPEPRYSSLSRIGEAAEHHAAVVLDAGGVPFTITGTTRGAGPEINQVVFRGTRACYRTRDIHCLERFDGDGWVDALPPVRSPERDTHLRQLDNIANLLAGQPHSMADFSEALSVQEVVERMIEP